MGEGDDQIRCQFETMYRKGDAGNDAYTYAYLHGTSCHARYFAPAQMMREILAEWTEPNQLPPCVHGFGWSMGGNGLWNAASFDYKFYTSLTSLAGYGNGTRKNLDDEMAVTRFAH